jgi:hypothetical protein
MNRLNREREAERVARIKEAGGNTTPYSEQMGNVGRFIDRYVPDPRDIFKSVIQAPGYEWFGKDSAPAAPVAPTAMTRGQAQPTPQQIENAAPLPKIGDAAGLGGTKEAAALRPAKAPGAARLDTGLGAAATEKAGDYASMDPEAMFSAAMKKAALEPHPQAKELKELGDARVKAKQEEVTGLEAIQKQFNDIYKGRKERLNAKETEITKMGDQNLGLALLQAGAAMMSTPGGVGMAIGKGVDVGSKGYASGLERINAAKDKLSDARDRLEEIEAQRGELSARELFKARNEVKTTELSAKEDLIKANMDMFKVNRETAIKMVESRLTVAKTVYEQNQQNVRAKLQADTTLAAAGMRGEGRGELTAKDRAAIADKAMDNVNATLKANVPLQIKASKDPAYLQQLVQAETARLLAAAEGRTITAAPGAPSPGGNRPPLSSFQR